MGKASEEDYFLTEAEVSQFHTDGYITLPDVLSEEELVPLEEIYMKLIRNETGVDFKEDYGDHSSPAGTPQHQWKMINVTLPSVHFPPFAGNLFEKRGLSIARQLYRQHGSAMVWEYDQLLAKRPNRSDAVFPAHQDSGYWYTPKDFPTATATCSLAINDADQAFIKNILSLSSS